MICPKCKAEYRDGYAICSDCKVELVEESKTIVNVNNEILVYGRKLACPICGGAHFINKNKIISHRTLRFVESDWKRTDIINYICASCGYILWFADIPTEEKEQMDFINRENSQPLPIDCKASETKADECPLCFNKINSGEKECPNCGYKFI